jgi:hypothetical protein
MPIPTVGKTIAIIFGASSFPSYPTLDASTAVKESADSFKDYLTSYHGLRLPSENVKWLFDHDLQPGQLVIEIRKFITERLGILNDVADVIFYYCGHGGYLNDDEYFLALCSTNKDSKEPTVFKIKYLRDIVADLTKGKRNLIVLDACYSGAALGEFAHSADREDAADLVTSQIAGITREQNNMASQSTEAMASEGIVLFCAAGAKKWAKTPLEARYTMFTGTLLKVLEDGDQKGGPFFTLKKMAELVQRDINGTFGTQAVQPQIHVPVQGKHDILQSPYFPNPAFDITDFEARLSDFDIEMRKIKASVEELGTNLSRELDEKIRQVIRVDVPTGLVEANRTHVARSGMMGLLSVAVGANWRWLLTISIFVGLDLATWLGLRIAAYAYASGSKTPVGIGILYVYIYWALGAHSLIAFGSACITVARGPQNSFFSAESRPLPWWSLFPPVNYSFLFWNSLLVMAVLGFLLLLPLDELYYLILSVQATAATSK